MPKIFIFFKKLPLAIFFFKNENFGQFFLKMASFWQFFDSQMAITVGSDIKVSKSVLDIANSSWQIDRNTIVL